MAIDVPNTSLSANDARILNALFDPETLPSSVAKSKDSAAINASLPPHPSISAPQLSSLEAQQNKIVQQVSSSSDIPTIDSTISQLDDVLASCPNYPSAYLNRAMLRRMRIEATLNATQAIFSPSALSSPNKQSDLERLFSDLATAIHVSLPPPSTAAVSPYQARILRTAFSHRAYLYLKAVETDAEWKGMGKSELEEAASRDFAAAARYGDEVAREMSVRTNPYAKMCGAIVRNALREEREGFRG